MANEENQTTAQLTLNDPVPAETLEQFRQLDDARARVGLRLLDLEQERIALLGASKRLKDQKDRLFETLLIERGLTPNTPVQIDAKTGLVSLLEQPAVEEPATE